MYVTLNDNGVTITVFDGPYLDNGCPTESGVSYYTDIISRLDELTGFAADHLLKLYNETWLDDAIGEIDRAGFMARHAPDRFRSGVLYVIEAVREPGKSAANS